MNSGNFNKKDAKYNQEDNYNKDLQGMDNLQDKNKNMKKDNMNNNMNMDKDAQNINKDFQ